MFDNKINNNLQVGIVLNIEFIMLDSFIQIFGMVLAHNFFWKFWQFIKNN
jgi:hypothetical protein